MELDATRPVHLLAAIVEDLLRPESAGGGGLIPDQTQTSAHTGAGEHGVDPPVAAALLGVGVDGGHQVGEMTAPAGGRRLRTARQSWKPDAETPNQERIFVTG